MSTPRKGEARKIIESTPGGTVFTGDGVQIYQLLAVKHALRLEERGLVMTKNRRKLRPLWAEKLGLNKNAVYNSVYAAIDKKIRELEQANGLTPAD